MKKSVSVILAMTLAAALTGCSSGSQTGETTAASQAETEASQEETKVQETETSQEDAETSSQSEPSQDGSLKIGSLKGPTSCLLYTSQSGFPSPSSFNRMFKQVNHCTPTEFKKLMRQSNF